MTRSTTAFNIRKGQSFQLSGWPLKACRHRSSQPNLMWWVCFNMQKHMGTFYYYICILTKMQIWFSVVIRHLIVGAVDERCKPISLCRPLWHHTLLVEGTQTSPATVLSRYSVSIIPAHLLSYSILIVIVKFIQSFICLHYKGKVGTAIACTDSAPCLLSHKVHCSLFVWFHIYSQAFLFSYLYK